MTFEALDLTHYDYIALGLLLPTFIFGGYQIATGKKLYLIGMLVFGVTLCGLILHVQFNVKPDTQQKAAANISKKYDVKEVLWNAKQTTATAANQRADETLVVELNDGAKYVFNYKIDKATSEPTLSDLPIQGGSNTDKVKSANDILKTSE